MNEAFLTRYEEELSYFRESASIFSDQYPKIAGRLRIDSNSIEDPHVARLIEAFAFLTARTRLKIDDEFPEICEAMLQALYPHYLAPFPPVMMVQLQHISPQAMDNPNGLLVERGVRIETGAVQGEPCRFESCYATRVLPIKVAALTYLGPPFPVPELPIVGGAGNSVEAIVHLQLQCVAGKLQFNQLNLDRLRLFFGSDPSTAGLLYENVMRDCVGVGIGSGKEWQFAPPSCLLPVGFSDSESLQPASPRQLSAYRVLSEYFVFPEKFRFVDVELGKRLTQSTHTTHLDIVFYLNRSIESLARNVSSRSIQLNCTPAINRFVQRAEPIRLNDLKSEYRVIPNARRTKTLEVLSIDRVTARTSKGDSFLYRPFYASSHLDETENSNHFWYASRRPAPPSSGETDRGSEVYLTLVDLNGRRNTENDCTLDVETTCLNRDLVARLPSAEKLGLKIMDVGGMVTAACVVSPTATYRQLDRTGYHWRLISQLSLNHLSLTDPQGAQSLREILKLYNPSDSLETRSVIESIQRISFSRERAITRVSSPKGQSMIGSGLCRGLDIEMWLDPDRLVGSGSYLFATVMEHFFGLFATLNSFTRTTVHLEKSDVPFLRGKARAGHLPLI